MTSQYQVQKILKRYFSNLFGAIYLETRDEILSEYNSWIKPIKFFFPANVLSAIHDPKYKYIYVVSRAQNLTTICLYKNTKLVSSYTFTTERNLRFFANGIQLVEDGKSQPIVIDDNSVFKKRNYKSYAWTITF